MLEGTPRPTQPNDEPVIDVRDQINEKLKEQGVEEHEMGSSPTPSMGEVVKELPELPDIERYQGHKDGSVIATPPHLMGASPSRKLDLSKYPKGIDPKAMYKTYKKPK